MKEKVYMVLLKVNDLDGIGANAVKFLLENTDSPNDCISAKVEKIEEWVPFDYTDTIPAINDDPE